MAKVQTKCATCGGTFDGTPSGTKRHNATTRHALAKATAAKIKPDVTGPADATTTAKAAKVAAAKIKAAAVEAGVPEPSDEDVAEAMGTDAHDAAVAAFVETLPVEPVLFEVGGIVVFERTANGQTGALVDLRGLITDAQAELARRQIDLRWRVKHQPTKAADYEDAKVRPLVDQIAILSKVQDALVMLGGLDA